MTESYKLSSEFIAFVPQHSLHISLFFIMFPRTTDSEIFCVTIYVIKCYLCVACVCVCCVFYFIVIVASC